MAGKNNGDNWIFDQLAKLGLGELVEPLREMGASMKGNQRIVLIIFAAVGLLAMGRTVFFQLEPEEEAIVLRLGKPLPEIIFSAIAGIIFSVAAYRSKSFVPAFVAHWGLAATLDAIVFVQEWGWEPILNAFAN